MWERFYLLIGIGFFIIFTLYTVRIYISNQLNIQGIGLYDTVQKTKTLQAENIILQKKVLTAKALITIEKKALAKGYHNPLNIIVK